MARQSIFEELRQLLLGGRYRTPMLLSPETQRMARRAYVEPSVAPRLARTMQQMPASERQRYMLPPQYQPTGGERALQAMQPAMRGMERFAQVAKLPVMRQFVPWAAQVTGAGKTLAARAMGMQPKGQWFTEYERAQAEKLSPTRQGVPMALARGGLDTARAVGTAGAMGTMPQAFPLAAGFGATGQLLKNIGVFGGGRQPLTKGVGEAAVAGAESAWVTALTWPLVDKVAGIWFPQLTTPKLRETYKAGWEAMRNLGPQAKGVFTNLLRQAANRAILETPIEALAWGTKEALEENKKWVNTVTNNLITSFVWNMASNVGPVFAEGSWIKSKPFRDTVKEQFSNLIQSPQTRAVLTSQAGYIRPGAEVGKPKVFEAKPWQRIDEQINARKAAGESPGIEPGDLETTITVLKRTGVEGDTLGELTHNLYRNKEAQKNLAKLLGMEKGPFDVGIPGGYEAPAKNFKDFLSRFYDENGELNTKVAPDQEDFMANVTVRFQPPEVSLRVPGAPEEPSEWQPKIRHFEEVARTPEQKVIDALKRAEPVRGAQERLYTAERGKRLGAALAVGEKITGEKGFYAELGQLKGPLPKAQYESIRSEVGQQDIDNLFIKIKENPRLTEWEKINAREGLAKMFGEGGGQVPTKGEISLLEQVFPPEFVEAVLEKRPLIEKLSEAGYQIANIPRALMASYDFSFGFRQGLFLATRYPKQFFSAFVNQFKYFGSKRAFNELQNEIASRPTYKLMKENGLALTRITEGDMTAREEAFMSSWAAKIPIIGKGVAASNRAYTGFANKLRADVFDQFIKIGKESGIDDPRFLKDAADFVNSGTGRGSLGSLSRASTALNTFFFSPRLMASRLNLLNPAYYIKLHPAVRKEALKSLFGFASTGLTMLTLAKMGGAEIGADPRSADFGKIKIGNTRIDIWGGFQQYVRLAAQLIRGQLVSSTTGKVITLGEGYRPLTRLEILGRALEYKQAPIISFASDLLRGSSIFGEKLTLKSVVGQRFVPMVMQDVYDLYKEHGPEGMPLGILPIFGFGLQTYGPKEPAKVKVAPRLGVKPRVGVKQPMPAPRIIQY